MGRVYAIRGGQSSVNPVKTEADLRNFIDAWGKARDAASKPEAMRLADRNRMLILLGINTALRFSDLRTLTVEEVRYNAIERRDKKTGKENKFSLNPKIYREVMEYVARRGLSGRDYLFPSRNGVNSPITQQQGYNVIQGAKAMAGIRYKLGTHTLRKTYGFWFYRQTGDIVALQQILNHSSPAQTLIYIGMQRAEVQEKRAKFALV